MVLSRDPVPDGSVVQCKCALNVLWKDILWLAVPHVPISSAKMTEFQNFHLDPGSPPAHFPVETVFAVDMPGMDVVAATDH